MASFTSYLQSPTIRLITSSGQEYVAHRALLSHHLPLLSLPTRLSYVEVEGDDESVGHLLEYLYTGDYTVSTATPETPGASRDRPLSKQQKNEEKSSASIAESHPMVIASRTSGLGVWGRPSALHTSFFHETAPPPVDNKHNLPGITRTESPSPPSSTASHSDPVSSTSTFLGHAKVFVLAEHYGLTSLQTFALQKLRAALKTAEIEPQSNGITVLASFIKDVYALPDARQESNESNARQHLKDIVITQAVNHLADLQKVPDFNTYVKSGKSDFVSDLLSNMSTLKISAH